MTCRHNGIPYYDIKSRRYRCRYCNEVINITTAELAKRMMKRSETIDKELKKIKDWRV